MGDAKSGTEPAVLHISPETEAIIRAKAAAEGKTPEELLRKTFATQRQAGQKPDVERMRRIVKRASSRPLLDERSEKELTDEGWGL
jgi:hypothetical protein